MEKKFNDDNTNLALSLSELPKIEREEDQESNNVQNTSKHVKSEVLIKTMNLTSYEKFINDNKSDDDDDDSNSNLAFGLSDLYKTNNEDAGTKVQNSTTLVNADDLTKTIIKQSQYANEELINVEHQEAILKQQQSRLATTKTSAIPPCTNAEDFIGENACSISLAGRTHLQITSIDGFFNRKRGRPPKNRFVEVYKNTHQKPQAIFTSFKLEKHGTSDTTENPENSANYCLHTDLQTLRDGDNDGNTSSEYSRHKSFANNSTQHFQSGETVGNTSCIYSRHKPCITNSTQRKPSYDKDIPISNGKICIMSLSSAALDVNTCLKKESIPRNCKSPTSNKEKICATTENITVVRAAGTFYPENSNEMSKFTDMYMENLHDIAKKKRISSTYTDETQFLENSDILNGYDMPQDLSTKDTKPNGESTPEGLSMAASTTSSVLPQILNVLQMQQQLFAFYQQMALMTPQQTFSHSDLKTLFTPTLTPANMTAPSLVMDSSNQDVPHKQQQHFLNMLLSLNQMQQGQTLNDANENSKSKSEKQQEQKETPMLTIKTATKMISNRHSRSAQSKAMASTTQHSASVLMQDGNFYNGRERTPSGYLRFRFNEDCGYDKCGYRQHQSHFHCNRSDCQYSFCDKTRFVQHTARHERLDTLMGSDFQQYRATMSCNYDNCPYNNNNSTEDHNEGLMTRKSSHFHCLKCPFVCADTNKVVAHRRLHSKMEFIRLAGFRKVASNEECMANQEAGIHLRMDAESSPQTGRAIPGIAPTITAAKKPPDCSEDIFQPRTGTIQQPQQHCPYSMRHAHYHCLMCNSSVLSRSQLVAHKHRIAGMSSTLVSSPSSSDAALQLSPETITTTSRNSNIS